MILLEELNLHKAYGLTNRRNIKDLRSSANKVSRVFSFKEQDKRQNDKQ
jgi:hypothetical protein